jgi:hypothetical protein
MSAGRSGDPEAGVAWLGCFVLVGLVVLVGLAVIDVRLVVLWILLGAALAVVLDTLVGD